MRILHATLLIMLAMTWSAMAASLEAITEDNFDDRVETPSFHHPVAVFFWTPDLCAP